MHNCTFFYGVKKRKNCREMVVDLTRLKKAVGKWFVDFKGVEKCVGKLKNIAVET